MPIFTEILLHPIFEVHFVCMAVEVRAKSSLFGSVNAIVANAEFPCCCLATQIIHGGFTGVEITAKYEMPLADSLTTILKGNIQECNS
jgi:hypothetical protein